MMEPLVSFVIPVYNAEKYLGTCVDSILAQTVHDWELILVDDGSCDGSAALCDAYAKQDARIHVIHKSNERQAAARNDGMLAATGQWLCFVDADDWIAPDLIEVTTNTTDTCNVQMILFGFSECRGQTVTPYPVTDKFAVLGAQTTQQMAYKALNRFAVTDLYSEDYLYASPCCRLYARAWLLQSGIVFTRGYFEDILFETKLFDHCTVVNLLPSCLYFYRIHADSTSRGFQPDLALLEEQLWETQAYLQAQHDDQPLFMQALHARAVHVFSYIVAIHICHPDNPLPYHQRKQLFLQKRHQAVYAQGLQNTDTRAWPLQRRMLAFLSRRGCFSALNLLNKGRIWAQQLVKTNQKT